MSQAEELIEFCLSHRPQIGAAILEERARLSGGGHSGGGGGHCRVSDPTALHAIRELTPIQSADVAFGPFVGGGREHLFLRWPEKWYAVAQKVEQHYMGKGGSVARFYESRYIDHDLWRRTCTELRITHGAYYNLRRDVLQYAALYAVHHRLLEPTEDGLKITR